jgi:hypothetical protein
MRDIVKHANGLILVSDQVRVEADDRQLRTSRGKQELRRLRRGAYVERAVDPVGDDDASYDLRIAAVLGTRRTPVVLSHYSAARVWGLPIVNRWPFEVHLAVAPESARRSRNGVIVHRCELARADVTERAGILVTGIERTLVDLARTAAFRDSVAAIDFALNTDQCKLPSLLLLAESMARQAGTTKALRAIRFASPLAKLPAESFARVLMHELGFPPPILQHEFSHPIGGRRFADFWWPELRLIGEVDGKGKYFDRALSGGLSPQEVFWAEKRRENELRDHDTRLTRWTWEDMQAVFPFIDRLESAGLRRTTRAGSK